MARAAVLGAALLLAAACGSGQAVEPQPKAEADALPKLSGRVVDAAGILSDAEERQLSAMSADAQRDTRAQLIVATVPSLKGRPIEEYSLRLARSWGLGSRERNDGILFLVASKERKVRIEVGTGLEKRVTDPFASKVLREDVLPRFSKSDFAGGIKAGVGDIAERLRSRAGDAEIAALDGVVG